MRVNNHPMKGDTIKVDPIRDPKDIKLIKKMLADNPRNLCLFVVACNTALRASDLLKIRIGQVRDLEPGRFFTVRERKTGKERSITVNNTVHEAIKSLLKTMPDAQDHEPLFQSRKGKQALCVPYFSGLVKGWCREANLKGNFGSHSCRKTTGYQLRVQHRVDIPTLMVLFNHSTQRQTLTYLGIQESDIKSAYMNEI